ncbi:arsenate reductase [Pseudoalteromonas espejiana DSM 9414]|uniref:Arsenate reductase n=1 Tax=Pseudoalteromonas espejiana TaxID=28107 RepID=A0A510XQ95_9GAMM|nr:arsenate reductase (glutaredoxin) [Pseudoalteromonas espejiana]ASM48655.1 arsenate reductase [Pseudoalteromonas espejiana DSM 9414]GEK53206.1 arsenate reductase [Pseudoalteromonas espejiana]
MVVIHHNPECGTSRNVLNIIKAAGYTPTLIEYIKEGWTKPQLQVLFAAAGLTPKTALRVTKSPAKELGLLDDSITDEAILEAMLTHPILVNRPIVCTAKGVKLCRPSESVLSLLAQWPQGELYKEDGEMILNSEGKQP